MATTGPCCTPPFFCPPLHVAHGRTSRSSLAFPVSHFHSHSQSHSHVSRLQLCPHAAVAESPVAPEASPPQLSESLIMNFKAEGTIAESLVPKVSEALKNLEGVSNVKVSLSEGVATVELTKETNIQATGDASSLVEMIQGQGFKLQTLGISFDDNDADGDNDIMFEYENSS